MTSSTDWPTAQRNGAKLWKQASTLIRPTTKMTPSDWARDDQVNETKLDQRRKWAM
jgi:hypothetical protein